MTPAIRDGLWGGVPDPLRPLYTVCMFSAAAGYFPFTALFVFRISGDELEAYTRVRLRWITVLYALVLIPSAMWLPLTAWLIESPSGPLFALIRLVLAVVAVGSTGLLVTLWLLAWRRGGWLVWAGALGSVPFWIQTAVLDALVWPAYYRG